jgi:hypothetical protein
MSNRRAALCLARIPLGPPAVDFKLACQLHPGHQISGRPDATHTRGQYVRDVHPHGVSNANLQPVGLANLDQ